MSPRHSKSDIKQSSAMAIAASLAAGTAAYGAIQYTDIPDVVISNSTYGLDINNDGVTNFIFSHNTSINTNYTYGQTITSPPGTGTQTQRVGGVGVYAAGPGNAVNVTASSKVPFISSSGASFNGGGTWESGSQKNMGKYDYQRFHKTAPVVSNFTNTTSTWYGPWITAGSSTGFVGLQFTNVVGITTNTHYGWARVHVDPTNGTMTVFDYAYEDSPGLGIHASAVPEPTTLVGMAVGAAAILAHRRRKKKKEDAES